jgi:hypothetical protein
MKNLITCICVCIYILSCTKPKNDEYLLPTSDSTNIQVKYLKKIKTDLKDSVVSNDYDLIDFSKAYRSSDVQKKHFYLRIGFIDKEISKDFLLLFTDSAGNILRGRIVHVNKEKSNDSTSPKYSFKLSTLNRQKVQYLLNKRIHSNVDQLLADDEDVVGEQILPTVVVTAHIYTYGEFYTSSDWFLYDALSGDDNFGGGGSGPNGNTYTYGEEEPKPRGESDPDILSDVVTEISFEDDTNPTIELEKYVKCFSNLPDAGATYEISIFADLPVNSDPYKLFDLNTGACGHAFIQLKKTYNGTVIQQNIGFYPSSGWKSIEANAPVSSKLADNAGHEFNASLTVSVDATHFQNAINEALYQGTARYDIDNNNCTDFALNVFNAAAPVYLDIPLYHIPGGMYGELSNTPQGLYNKLRSLNTSGGYQGGNIQIPGVLGTVGISNGACQ